MGNEMKKIVILLTLVITAFFCTISLFACDGGNAVEFKLKFVAEGQVYATIETNGAETIKMPENPEKDGYSFDGWFWDKDVWEKPFTANSLLDAPLSSDMSVYAKFTIKHEHSYNAVITAPTCTERGYTTYTCECGDSYIDDYTDKLQHEFTDYVSDNNATYDSDGTKTAHCNHGCGATDIITDVGTKLQSGIAFKTLAVDGNNAYGKIPNDETTFDFLTEIEKKGNVTYKVSNNIAGSDIIESRTAEPNVGNNKYYILVYQNGELLSRYNVTIRRREIYDVTFNTDGGTAIEPQRIEEDSFATEPTTTRAGYTLTGWNYNFYNPITENTVITANWVANTKTLYKVEYYLQNLADDNYTLDFTDNLTGTTDTQATAEIKTYNHYTFNESQSIVSGNINGDGTTVLKVYYTRDIYKFTVTNENTKGGSIDCTDNESYRFGKQINLLATVNDGYDFVGWFNGDTKISAELQYSFTLNEKTDITAKYFAHTDTPYKVEYYLENLDGTYILKNSDTEEFTGTTDTTAIIQIEKNYEHYNIVNSTVSGNINGDGSAILKVYYNLEQFKIYISSYSNVKLSQTYNGNYKYGFIIPTITIAAVNLGYEYTCWNSDGIFMTNDNIIPSFMVDKNINYIATCTVKNEMANFNFTSTETTCKITGIKNKMITEIIVPDYVTTINQGAFSGCSTLVSLTIPFVGGSKNPTSQFDHYPFGYIFGTSDYTGGMATQQFGYDIREKISETYYIPQSLRKVTVTGGNILYKAFYNCSSLTEITIPNCVTSIGEQAFQNCGGLTEITIPDTVTIIGSYAFFNCSGLTNITIGNNVTKINGQAFAGCSNLMSVTIPNSITIIGGNVFSSCNGLTSIYYKGTTDDWYNIQINKFNSDLTLIKRYYYSEAEPQLNNTGTAYNGNFWHYDTDGITPIIWVKEN